MVIIRFQSMVFSDDANVASMRLWIVVHKKAVGAFQTDINLLVFKLKKEIK